MEAIELRNVTKRYGDTCAVEGLSLAVAPGEAVCLFGPSGCGKTTALRLAAGLERPDAGQVFRHGVEVWATGRPKPPEPGALGMVFQDGALWPHMRVQRHLDFVLRDVCPGRTARRDRVHALLAACYLTPLRRADRADLSGGEQQRLAIARALAADPPILLMDEPFADLDAALGDHFVDAFRQRKRAGAALLFATHSRTQAEALADRIVELR